MPRDLASRNTRALVTTQINEEETLNIPSVSRDVTGFLQVLLCYRCRRGEGGLSVEALNNHLMANSTNRSYPEYMQQVPLRCVVLTFLPAFARDFVLPRAGTKEPLPAKSLNFPHTFHTYVTRQYIARCMCWDSGPPLHELCQERKNNDGISACLPPLPPSPAPPVAWLLLAPADCSASSSSSSSSSKRYPACQKRILLSWETLPIHILSRENLIKNTHVVTVRNSLGAGRGGSN